tara:strand:+ start:11347 stop:12507 length:1161 start_codon:yes stop_codon:yes gene_type:complete
MNINKKKTIFYWSPCLNPVGTINSTLNSASALIKYKSNEYDVFLINACGEWDQYLEFINLNKIKLINLQFKYFKFLPKRGYFQSRLSYILIFLFSFFPLARLIKKYQPDYVVNHLITSLPLSLLIFFKFKSKFILRISGFPKLNIIRKNFWKYVSHKLYCITSPSEELKQDLNKLGIFQEEKIFNLPDAIINIENFIKKKKEKFIEFEKIKQKKIIFSVGRLTKQKNFSYLINEFSDFCSKNDDFILYILGDGEEMNMLKKKIIEKKMSDKIFLKGHVDNVYKYLKYGDLFILSSKWEEVGFVIVEAALSNLFVISSDCPNGPSEFLNYGTNGILFKSNQKGALNKALQNFVNLEEKQVMKVKLKKNADKYTMFKHFKIFDKILSN